MKALILTGGAGRTLVPFSSTRPKSMTVVAGGSLLRRTLNHLAEVGVTDITIVLGQHGDKVRQTFSDGGELGLNLSYVEQNRASGIADAILCARKRFIPGEYFILVYADIVTSGNPFHQALLSFNSFKGPIAGVCLPGPPTGRYGNVYLSGTRITKIVEKPNTEGLGNYVLSGVFVMPSESFAWLDQAGGDMERMFDKLVESPSLHASIWEEGWIDVEYPWDVLAANRMVMDTWEEARISRHAEVDGNVTITGPVRIERGSVIKSGAILAGPCYIGRDCYVGNNVLVRSYSSLGAGSSIGYGVELKNCVLFGNSTVGRLSFVGDSVIGENTDIGSGTMTVNERMDRASIAVEIRGESVDSGLTKLGAFLGDDVKVGAGHTLAAGTVLAPGTNIAHHATIGDGELGTMCGITGVASFHSIDDRLYQGVHHLEYRGYDSCGIAFLENSHIEIRKNIGTVDEVDSKECIRNLAAHVGIAHTRWATHGKVTRENAHPHLSCKGDFAVVHNGIIVNYKALRATLMEAGHRFKSETDTEIIAHLIEEHYGRCSDVELALVSALRELEGSYALALIAVYDPERIFCARHESPLIIGLGSESNYVGSDFNAFIDYTKNTVILDDGEYGIVSKDSYSVKSLRSGEPVDKPVTVIPWDSEMSRKGGYPHYMLKEIHEQPQAVRTALNIDKDAIAALAETMADAKRVYLLGVGTTYYVGLYGQYILAQLADLDVSTLSSDEFRYLDKTDSTSLVLAVSQSGETYDTVMSLRHAKARGAKTAAIVNVVGSSIARAVDSVILQGSGPEVCVVSTKAALVQMLLLTRLAIELGTRRKVLNAAKRREYEAALAGLPGEIETLLNEKSGLIRAAAYRHSKVKNWLFLGRGIYYPIALEAALKMKEVTYIHAEGMPGGFLKHGTLSLVDDQLYTLVVVPPPHLGELYAMTMSSVEEVKARGGFVFGFTFDDKDDIFSDRVALTSQHELTAPFLPLVGTQLLAYFTATALKRNVDKPRSLAKSVTVA